MLTHTGILPIPVVHTYTHSTLTDPGPKEMKKLELHACSLEPVQLGQCELIFQTDNHGRHYISSSNAQSKTYTEIHTLLHDHPEILREQQWTTLAIFLNFFLKGEEFTVITDPESYRKEYQEKLDGEADPFSFASSSLIAYGTYDLKEIQAPTFEKDKQLFRFYVKNKIPYRVTCSLPLQPSPKCKYEILSYL